MGQVLKAVLPMGRRRILGSSALQSSGAMSSAGGPHRERLWTDRGKRMRLPSTPSDEEAADGTTHANSVRLMRSRGSPVATKKGLLVHCRQSTHLWGCSPQNY